MTGDIRVRLTFYRDDTPDLFDALADRSGRARARLLKQLILHGQAHYQIKTGGPDAHSEAADSQPRTTANQPARAGSNPALVRTGESALERFGLDPSNITFE